MNRTMHTFLVICGWISVVIGVIALFVPLVPTTPFLILGAACFSKSSPRFHAWLLNHKILGPVVLDWEKNKVIRTRYKVIATGMMVCSFIVILFFTPHGPGQWMAGGVLLIASIYIWTRKSH